MTGWTNPNGLWGGYAPTTAQQTILPPQQVIRVKGRDGLSALRLAPNSSVLIMEEDRPVVWLCISDGLGNVTPTPYDITPHVDAPPVDVGSLDERIRSLENMLKEMTAREPNAGSVKSE